ncbi:HD-GYP domain-containing protein [Paraneptunicella aestuarii]|uniref:HD-GYP domain-containing protein n=1 Tax=Paraneptunicella aestuarii TaxID=2831148 RepID=UPI001E48B18E|nr:HD-GYP domain-containing protein [Paraneptunicella aestuarii]UAA37965.1 HD-GYP domain-containing protein [Paraneptunicella aestuarii]
MAEGNFKHVLIDDLVPGMFVNQVLKQSGQLRIKSKGLVKNWDVIDSLKGRGIQEVEVDLSRSIQKEIDKHSNKATEQEVPQENHYIPPEKTEGEALNDAQKLYDKAKLAHSRFLKKVQAGDLGNLQALKDTSQELVDSLFENSNAIMCLTLIKEDNEYLLQHSLNNAILMGMFAKHLGFDKELIEELSLAGLLMDTGMATMPDDIHNKSQKLSNSEWNIVKTHVDIGIEMIEQSVGEGGEISETVLSTIANHHERLDGSGYPVGKKGENISTYGRMAAIVDTYDALTSNRPYRKALPPTTALKKLLADDSGKLDQSLVQQFIKCVGVHPVGSLVKLKSDKLGIIIKANHIEPLKPVIMTFYSIKSGNHTELKRLDLSKVKDDIVTSVRPEEFRINLTKFFREIFLANMK